MRILLFLATNLAVLVLVSVIFNLLGLEGILANNGVDLNLLSLLIFCGLFGMSGSLISLLLSKFMAKRGTGTQLIETPVIGRAMAPRHGEIAGGRRRDRHAGSRHLPVGCGQCLCNRLESQ